MTEQATVASMQATRWSTEEFGSASLGDKRLDARLLLVATAAALAPHGRVTEVFKSDADREGAYRFLENDRFGYSEVAQSTFGATVQRTKDLPFVFVPVDGSTLSPVQQEHMTGFGPVGTSTTKTLGVESYNAICVTPDGTPLGLAGQVWWTRPRAPLSKKRKAASRNVSEKETRHWFEAINQVEKNFGRQGIRTGRWYQLDAGADFKELLAWAQDTKGSLVTVRAAQDRRIQDTESRLWETLERNDPAFTYTLPIPAGRKRTARAASIEVRYAPVKIALPLKDGNTQGSASLWAVLAKEVGTVPDNEEPIEWVLLSNLEMKSDEDARLVIYGYTLRWRVEEFHRAWKEVCRIEESQLADIHHFLPWAIILGAVAMRLERLKYQARNKPDAPACDEFTAEEIEALLLTRKARRREQPVTIYEAVLWIAKLGGHMGNPKKRLPGTLVLTRGLRDLASRVDAIHKYKESLI